MSNLAIHKQSITLQNRNQQWGSFRCAEIRSKPRQSPGSRHLIILSDIFGCATDFTVHQAERFLNSGLVEEVFIPDLFIHEPYPVDLSVQQCTDKETWRSENALPYERVVDIVLTTAMEVMHRREKPRIALVGYCYGGGRLTEVVVHDSLPEEIRLAIAFYPTRVDPENIEKTKIPVLMVFGEKDKMVPLDLVDTFAQSMEMMPMERRGRVEIFKGRDHGFVHHGTPDDASDSDKAMHMAFDWLHKYL